MNQKRADELDKLANKVYNDWQDENDSNSKWRLPFWIYVSKRRQKCQYCDNDIMMGELRTVPISAHISCYMQKLQLANSFLIEIKKITNENRMNKNEPIQD